MDVVLMAILWVASLSVAIYASEKLVHAMVTLGQDVGLRGGVIGLLVALGADGPEITSALIALGRGSTAIGLGVVMGSNIYNLAGLLGLAAVLSHGVQSDRYRLSLDGGANLLMTLLLVLLLWLAGTRFPIGGIMLLLLVVYVAALSVPRERLLPLVGLEGSAPAGSDGDEEGMNLPVPLTIVVAVLSAALIVGGSDLLVNATIYLGPKLGVPTVVLGSLILPVATSLPNTWAAVSLARRGLAAAAISATFNSNTLNAALGAGLPSLFVSLHASSAARTIDAGWLLGMTVAAMLLLATRHTLSSLEGWVLIALYAVFVVVTLVFVA